MRSRIGLPHFVETDGFRTFGGDEDWWFFLNENGQLLALCLHVPYKNVTVMTDRANCPSVEAELTQAIGDSTYRRQEPEPYN